MKTQTTNLKLFTQSAILREIGPVRLAKLLAQFSGDLQAFNIPTPEYDLDHDQYFDAIANILAKPEAVPERLRVTLFALEGAAAPENEQRLDSAIQRRIPCVSLSPCCALDRALELWFHAPEELAQFQSRTGVSPVSGNTETPPSQQNP